MAGLKPYIYDNEQKGSLINSLAYYSLQSLLFNAHGLNEKSQVIGHSDYYHI